MKWAPGSPTWSTCASKILNKKYINQIITNNFKSNELTLTIKTIVYSPSGETCVRSHCLKASKGGCMARSAGQTR